MNSPLRPERDTAGTLVHVVETLLDKGLVLNADILVSVAGVELLGIRLRAALASFETAAKYGLEFPAGTDRTTLAWQHALQATETCPNCRKRSDATHLLEEFCPWCGWRSARALALEETRRQLESPSADLPSTGDNPTGRGDDVRHGA
jgi:gas vesicle structural protein